MKTSLHLLFLCLIMATNQLAAQTFPVDTLLMNGDVDKRINLVFMGDGYQEHELEKYIEDVSSLLNSLFEQSPFREYKSYFNAFAIKVSSAESGASHPQTTWDHDCTSVPQGMVNNYFGSTFDAYGVHRMLVPMKSEVLASVLAHNFPQYDHAFIIVNSPYYGGSGGVYATASTDFFASEVAIHELGHSFANLADEYWPGWGSERPNLTQEGNPAAIRWKDWLGTNEIGIYPFEENASWYRPHQYCKMRYLGFPFCAVCQEAFITRIQTLVAPVQRYTPAETNIELSKDQLFFSLDLVKPQPNTLQVVWRKNGIIISKDTSCIAVSKHALSNGHNVIQAHVWDTTALLRQNVSVAASARLTHRLYLVEWTINNNNVVTGLEVMPSERQFDIIVYPNPVNENFYLTYKLSKESKVKITLLDGLGKPSKILVDHIQPAGKYDHKLSTSQLSMDKAGVYFLLFDFNGAMISTKLMRY